MELKPIFVHTETGEGLYAIQYPGQESDEFERLFDLWSDTELVHNYCVLNEPYLSTEYFTGVSIDMIEEKIMNEAAELEVLLEEHCNQGLENNGLTLQMIFRPLDNNEHLLPIRQETKVKIHDTRNFPRPILRVYGIRLGDNTFVITGGSVKLTKYMKDHPDTNIELEKLKVVKAFLKENDIDTDEDLNYFYEQS